MELFVLFDEETTDTHVQQTTTAITRRSREKKNCDSRMRTRINCMLLETCAPIWLINFLKMTSIVLNEKQRVFYSSVRPTHTTDSCFYYICCLISKFLYIQQPTSNITATHIHKCGIHSSRVAVFLFQSGIIKVIFVATTTKRIATKVLYLYLERKSTNIGMLH